MQSLVLAREGLLAPEFGSIEEYLGRNTARYYAALQEVQGGNYQPQRDASSWVGFCVYGAHRTGPTTARSRRSGAAARWAVLEQLVGARLARPARDRA